MEEMKFLYGFFGFLTIFSLTNGQTVNITYYPPKGYIVFFTDSTNSTALNMEKELLKKLIFNWTNPERIALLDSGNMWGFKKCGSMNLITDLMTSIDAISAPAQGLSATSIENGLRYVDSNCQITDNSTKLYILYFVTPNVQLGTEATVKTMADHYNHNGRLTFVSMNYDDTVLNRISSHVIDWKNFANGTGSYPDNWEKVFYEAVGGSGYGVKASLFVAIVLLMLTIV